MAVELCGALGDHDRMRTWFQRMQEERSSLYLYMPLAVAGSADHDPEMASMAAVAAKIGK